MKDTIKFKDKSPYYAALDVEFIFKFNTTKFEGYQIQRVSKIFGNFVEQHPQPFIKRLCEQHLNFLRKLEALCLKSV